MDLNTYQVASYRTAKVYPTLAGNLEHAALGMTTEGGEVGTEVKRLRIYERELTDAMRLHIMEELGDFAWYVALAATALGINLGDIDLSECSEQLPGDLAPLDRKSQIISMLSMSCAGMWVATLEAFEGTPVSSINDTLAVALYAVTLACEIFGLKLEDVLQANLHKLQTGEKPRFVGGYSNEQAEARADKNGLPALVS